MFPSLPFLFSAAPREILSRGAPMSGRHPKHSASKPRRSDTPPGSAEFIPHPSPLPRCADKNVRAPGPPTHWTLPVHQRIVVRPTPIDHERPMLEALLEIIGELVVQGLAEVLAEIGLQAMGEDSQRRPHPFLAAIGYACFGAILGFGSLTVLPNNLVPESLRLANLILTPLAVGALMTAIGAWRARRGQPVLRIDRFAYGYLFALTFALVRFKFAN